MNRRVLICILGLCSLVGPRTATAQPRWGRERMPQAGACFFEDVEFRGRWFCVHPGERLDTMPNGMNDKISSMRVLGNSEVWLFRDKNLRGRSANFAHDVGDLRRGGWNDQVSSIQVLSSHGGGLGGGPGVNHERGLAWGRERQPREGACFYRDANFRGDYFCVPRGESIAILNRGFNDSISSIRVFGSRVRIFRDADFRGSSRDVSSDLHDLRGSWRDIVSSIRVY
jgi:Peptidase inhibitor family I36